MQLENNRFLIHSCPIQFNPAQFKQCVIVEMEEDLLSGYVMDLLIHPTHAIRQILSLINKIWYQNSCKLIPAKPGARAN